MFELCHAKARSGWPRATYARARCSTRPAIEPHLTVVFAVRAIPRYLNATGPSIKKIVRTPRPLQRITVRIAGHEHLAQVPLTDTPRSILKDTEPANQVTSPRDTS